MTVDFSEEDLKAIKAAVHYALKIYSGSVPLRGLGSAIAMDRVRQKANDYLDESNWPKPEPL
jgi:hypothetical protein